MNTPNFGEKCKVNYKHSISRPVSLLINKLGELSYKELIALSVKIDISYPAILRVKQGKNCKLSTLYKVAEGLGNEKSIF